MGGKPTQSYVADGGVVIRPIQRNLPAPSIIMWAQHIEHYLESVADLHYDAIDRHHPTYAGVAIRCA